MSQKGIISKNLNSLTGSDQKIKPKKGLFKKMYNFITRNKSDDEEDKKKKEEKKKVKNKNKNMNVDLDKLEKEFNFKDSVDCLMYSQNKEIINKEINIAPLENHNHTNIVQPVLIPNDEFIKGEVLEEIKENINTTNNHFNIDLNLMKIDNCIDINSDKILIEKSVNIEKIIPNINECDKVNNIIFNNNIVKNDLIKNIELNMENIEGFKPKDTQIIEISCCWSLLLKNPENIEEIFYTHLISKEEFFKDPWKILNNQDLVVRHGDNLYTWKAAAPLLISLSAFGEVPPETVMQPLLVHSEGGFMSYFQRTKPKKVDLLKIDLNKGRKTPKSNPSGIIVNSKEIIKELEKIELKVNEEEIKKSLNAINPIKRISVLFRKSFSPTSDQLKKLGLKYGRNEIRFSVTSRYQGTHTLVTDLYLWESDTRIVISDVDGTITRSDILGQLMPIFGKDWSHTGVTELFMNIEKNNYKVLYLTARAIGQSEQTKEYLKKLSQSL